MGLETIIAGIVGLITTVTSGFVSWLLAKRKYNAEVDSNIIENMQKSLDFYKQLSDDNKARLEEILRENANLKSEIDKLRDQMFVLMSNICYDTTCKLRNLEANKRKKSKDGNSSEKNV